MLCHKLNELIDPNIDIEMHERSTWSMKFQKPIILSWAIFVTSIDKIHFRYLFLPLIAWEKALKLNLFFQYLIFCGCPSDCSLQVLWFYPLYVFSIVLSTIWYYSLLNLLFPSLSVLYGYVHHQFILYLYMSFVLGNEFLKSGKIRKVVLRG